MSLRLQLTVVFGAVIAVILSAVAVSVFLLTDRSLNAGVSERAQSALSEITSGKATIAEGIRKLPSDTYYQILVVGASGRILSNVSQLKIGVTYASNTNIINALSDSALQALLDNREVSASTTLGGEQVRVLGRLGRIDFQEEERSIQAVFFVGIPSGLTSATLDQLKRDLALTVLIAFIVFALGVWVLSERVLASLKNVTEAAGHVSGSDLSRRVPVPKNHDEIRDLAVSINHMLDRLQESFETQRRFTADASHELRTPVTAISGHASYLLRRTEPTADQVDSLKVIQHEAERMAKLVNDLLELARADAGFTVELTPMNLVEVAETVVRETAPMAQGVKMEVRSKSPLAEVEGDPTRLKQVVLNLVQNAINAGATEVSITISEERNHVRLEVLDNGSGIAKEALPHLFDRFYRVDGARSSRGTGSGLGLAIVRWLVQQHSGSVEVESSIGEGTVVTVLLPKLSVRTTSEAIITGSTLVEGLKTWASGNPRHD